MAQVGVTLKMQGEERSKFYTAPDSDGGSYDYLWDRVFGDCGAAERLEREYGVRWADVQGRERFLMVLEPDAGRPPLDLASLALQSCRCEWEWDVNYARVSPHRLRADLTDIHPTDISALRSGMVPQLAFESQLDVPYHVRVAYALRLPAIMAAYLARRNTHFIPADLALDVATTQLPDPESLAALRLPGPWSMIIHEPVPLTAVAADDEALEEIMADERIDPMEECVLGAVLGAHEDGTVDTRCGLLLTTGVHRDGSRHLELAHADYGSHPAGRLLYSYAAQLAFAAWRAAPAVPEVSGGKSGSGRQFRRLVKTAQARAGALQGVRILDFRPPPDGAPEVQAANQSSGQFTFGTWRRAYWKPGVRIGIRDGLGQMVGPVYKTGVEGETFTRERRWIRSSRVRPDLPLRDEPAVYRVRGSDTRRGGQQ